MGFYRPEIHAAVFGSLYLGQGQVFTKAMFAEALVKLLTSAECSESWERVESLRKTIYGVWSEPGSCAVSAASDGAAPSCRGQGRWPGRLALATDSPLSGAGGGVPGAGGQPGGLGGLPRGSLVNWSIF